MLTFCDLEWSFSAWLDFIGSLPYMFHYKGAKGGHRQGLAECDTQAPKLNSNCHALERIPKPRYKIYYIQQALLLLQAAIYYTV